MAKNEFVVRTKRPAQYFRGLIKKGYFPIDDKEMWYVACLSFAGGARKDDPLCIINWKKSTRVALLKRLRSFAKRGKYIFSFSQSKF
jgi:hypothetical protein